MGIGAKPSPQWDLADWVLSRFSESEAKELTQAAENACKALALMVNGQEAQAMNQFNS